jgi:hypothetical protein
VLARAEVQSQYTPARKLWIRTRNGYYLPNPKLMLRTDPGQDDAGWRPMLEVLNLPWLDAGTRRSVEWAQALTELFENKSHF